MPNIQYIHGDDRLLFEVQPLWEKLNEHHRAKSRYFAELFAGLTFTERIADFRKKSKIDIRVDLARDLDIDILVGYCISTLDRNQVGEVDSMFVESTYRGLGIGDSLMRKALDWIHIHPVKSVQVSVSYGNEEVFGFYQRYGFRPRRTILIQKTQE